MERISQEELERIIDDSDDVRLIRSASREVARRARLAVEMARDVVDQAREAVLAASELLRREGKYARHPSFASLDRQTHTEKSTGTDSPVFLQIGYSRCYDRPSHFEDWSNDLRAQAPPTHRKSRKCSLDDSALFRPSLAACSRGGTFESLDEGFQESSGGILVHHRSE